MKEETIRRGKSVQIRTALVSRLSVKVRGDFGMSSLFFYDSDVILLILVEHGAEWYRPKVGCKT